MRAIAVVLIIASILLTGVAVFAETNPNEAPEGLLLTWSEVDSLGGDSPVTGKVAKKKIVAPGGDILKLVFAGESSPMTLWTNELIVLKAGEMVDERLDIIPTNLHLVKCDHDGNLVVDTSKGKVVQYTTSVCLTVGSKIYLPPEQVLCKVLGLHFLVRDCEEGDALLTVEEKGLRMSPCVRVF